VGRTLIAFVVRWLILALAVWAAAAIVGGIDVPDWQSALIVALVLGVLNVLLKPFLVILSLPITILTLGLFLIVINTVLLLCSGASGQTPANFTETLTAVCADLVNQLQADAEGGAKPLEDHGREEGHPEEHARHAPDRHNLGEIHTVVDPLKRASFGLVLLARPLRPERGHGQDSIHAGSDPRASRGGAGRARGLSAGDRGWRRRGLSASRWLRPGSRPRRPGRW
jgi:putative membrane protein